MRILILLPLLTACSTAGIKVVEEGGACTLSGTLVSVQRVEQVQVDNGVTFDYVYQGEHCTVAVSK